MEEFGMKAIIFDMDGLMIDSERLYRQVQYDIAHRFDRVLTEEIRRKMMGRKPIQSIRFFVKELNIPEEPEKILEYRSNIMREKLKTDLAAMPGLNHIIDTFYNRLKLAIATGAQKEFLDIVVDQLNIREKFHVLQHSDDIEKGKPDPEIYLKACSKLSLIPQDCIVLEDSLNGVLAGKSAGCFVIAVPSEYTRMEDFSPAGYVAADLAEAAHFIEKSFHP